MVRKADLPLLAVHFSGRPAFRTTRERAEVQSLVRRLAIIAGIDRPETAFRAVTLETLSGGRSAARVFRMTPSMGNGRRTRDPSVVVKIASRGQGTHEKTNYEKYVHRALPAACRPDLLAFARTRAYAGLCYSFVGRSGTGAKDTLTHCLQRGDTTKIALVLSKILAPMRETWYSASMRCAEADIKRRYLIRYFTGPRATVRAEAKLRACAERYFNARQEAGRYEIAGMTFPSPRATLFRSDQARPYRSCIIHGDLNSDNIVITDGPAGVAVVDFQKTGRGHVYEDLIFVEASIRINYAPDASFGEILDRERLIALGRRGERSDPYSNSIRRIRAAARRYFDGVEDDANYHFAVAATGLRLMLAVDLSHAARARITASTLWAAKALAGEL